MTLHKIDPLAKKTRVKRRTCGSCYESGTAPIKRNRPSYVFYIARLASIIASKLKYGKCVFILRALHSGYRPRRKRFEGGRLPCPVALQ